MKLIFTIVLLFNLAFADIFTSPTYMFVPGNIYHFSIDEQTKDKECNNNCNQEPSESDKIMICLSTICVVFSYSNWFGGLNETTYCIR